MCHFDGVVVCSTFCTMLVLNMVWSLIQGLQICKQILQATYTAMVHLKLVASKYVNVEKQVILQATLPDIESEILCCKDILFAKIT